MASSIRITVSGEIPKGPGISTVNYVVMDLAERAVVGSFFLPNASEQVRQFRIPVAVPAKASCLDVGQVDDVGKFVSAGFKIEMPDLPRGAAGRAG